MSDDSRQADDWELVVTDVDHASGIVTAEPWIFPSAEGIRLPEGSMAAHLLATCPPVPMFQDAALVPVPPWLWQTCQKLVPGEESCDPLPDEQAAPGK